MFRWRGNPFHAALGLGALAAFVLGIIAWGANQPDLRDPGSAVGQMVGVGLVCLGAVMAVAWLLAGAIIWQLRESAAEEFEAVDG